MKDSLKIVQIAPLAIEVSPNLKYAGTERIVFYLNQIYHQLGSESYVAGPGNSDLGGFGKLIETWPQNIWPKKGDKREIIESPKANSAHFKKCLELMLSEKYDIFHDHLGDSIVASKNYELNADRIKVPVVTTLHGDTIYNHERETFLNFKRKNYPIYLVALSQSQKRIFEEKVGVPIDEVVYNGIPLDKFVFSNKKSNYLLWLGRLCSQKGTDLAVRIAKKSRMPLILAGEVHSDDKDFFDANIKSHIIRNVEGKSFEEQEEKRNEYLSRLSKGEEIISDGEVFFFGPVDDVQKAVLFSNASALLMPNRFNEPFGLVMVEAMASGTPVVAVLRGSIPEVVEDNKTGFLVTPDENLELKKSEEKIVEEMSEKIREVGNLNSIDCRERVEKNFSLESMGKDYISFYRRLLKND